MAFLIKLAINKLAKAVIKLVMVLFIVIMDYFIIFFKAHFDILIKDYFILEQIDLNFIL